MQIRKAEPGDRPAIIELLKQSLGESTIPKSEALWSWKHEQNPFGASYVLIAEENKLLIGVRAFMQWTWQWRGENYKAIRAVDTATHPAHQGKGIFKKLTLEQADLCKKDGVDFIFNTPNQQSLPGYIKMGWVEQGRMPLKFKLVRPLTIAYAMLFDKNKFRETSDDPSPVQEWPKETFSPFTDAISQNTPLLTTRISSAYIAWRYAENPLFRYNFFTDGKNYLLISRIKKQSFRTELRLVDFILTSPGSAHQPVRNHIRKEIFKFCKKQAVDVISFSGPQFEIYKPYFTWMGMLPVRPLGPVVTFKDLNMKERFNALLDVNSWGYSLGDLELF